MTEKKKTSKRNKPRKRSKRVANRSEKPAAGPVTLGRPPMDPVGPLGQRIHDLAMQRFGSRTKLAHAAGIVPSRLSETIRGITAPQVSTLEKIAGACGITLSDLLSGETPTTAS